MQQGAQGLDAILQALALGGQPLGNLGQVPVGINPSTPTQQAGIPMEAVTANPTASAVSPVQAEQIQMLLQALLAQGGAGFNLGGVPNG